MFVIEVYSEIESRWVIMPGEYNEWNTREEAENIINSLDKDFQYCVNEIN